MTNDIFQSAQDATLLSIEKKEGLIQSHITSRGELNRSEQANILEAEEWVFKRDRDVAQINFLNGLHQRMFGRVWNWAGQFRKSGKNIGVDAYRIPGDLKLLCDDCNFWLEHEVYSTDEIAARFHHRFGLYSLLSKRKRQACASCGRRITSIEWWREIQLGCSILETPTSAQD